MARMNETEKRDARAIAVYRWAIGYEGDRFVARDIPEYSNSSINNQAIRLLVIRDLIMKVSGSIGAQAYKLKRVIPIETCLDIPGKGSDPTITHYYVAPSVANEIPTADNLQQYAITK